MEKTLGPVYQNPTLLSPRDQTAYYVRRVQKQGSPPPQSAQQISKMSATMQGAAFTFGEVEAVARPEKVMEQSSKLQEGSHLPVEK